MSLNVDKSQRIICKSGKECAHVVGGCLLRAGDRESEACLVKGVEDVHGVVAFERSNGRRDLNVRPACVRCGCKHSAHTSRSLGLVALNVYFDEGDGGERGAQVSMRSTVDVAPCGDIVQGDEANVIAATRGCIGKDKAKARARRGLLDHGIASVGAVVTQAAGADGIGGGVRQQKGAS